MTRSAARFMIGSEHKVCQDYALAYQEQACVVLSDGCSGSESTDIGARILALTAASALAYTKPSLVTKDTFKNICYKSNALISNIDLLNTSLDATLFALVEEKDKFIWAFAYGDGVIAARNKDKSIKVISISFPNESNSSYPIYPNYLLSPKREKEISEKYPNGWDVEEFTILPDGSVVDRKDSKTSQYLTVMFPMDGSIESISIMSDGIFSFRKLVETENSSYRESIPQELIISEMLNFKNYNGDEFLDRRIIFFNEICRKNKIDHFDDISIGTMVIEQDS